MKYLVCKDCQEECGDSIVFTSGDIRNSIFKFNNILLDKIRIAEQHEELTTEQLVLKTLLAEFNSEFEVYK